MQIKQLLMEQIPAFVSGLFGSMISLKFGGNIKGGLRGAIDNVLFTSILCGSVVWHVLGWWLSGDDIARFSASVIVGVFTYPIFMGCIKLVKLFSRDPLKFKDWFKK